MCSEHFPGVLLTQPCQGAHNISGRRAGQNQLPRRSMTEFHHLRAQFQFPVGAGGEIDLTHRYLRREAEPIGRGRAVGNNRFSALFSKRCDRAFHRGRTRPEAALDGDDVNAARDAKDLATSAKTRKRLVYGGAVPQVQEFLCCDRLAFGEMVEEAHVRSIA